MNGYNLEIEEDELVDLALQIAEGSLKQDSIAKALEQHSLELPVQEESKNFKSKFDQFNQTVD